ncbi:hypothetical protein [Paenibacillus sp. AN1007]|uniref:DUF1292 domain-containing protein n=1 Tax=Paenibacillus sp. AN1007 TaxID=3151385 RepID=A0AAU8NHT3_9BACL
MQIIHRLTVVSNPTRIFEVGTEIDGREVIEIKQVGTDFENHVHSEYYVLDENEHLLASIENAPVIVDYRQIVVHDSEVLDEKGLKAAASTTAQNTCCLCEEVAGLELEEGRFICYNCAQIQGELAPM